MMLMLVMLFVRIGKGHKNVAVKVIFIAPPLFGVSMGGGRHNSALLKADS